MGKVDAKKFGAAIRRGVCLGDAMIAAGYSPTSAKRGKNALSKECKQALEVATKKMFHRAQVLSEKTSDDSLRHAVRGGLIQNISERCDKGVQSLKLAGSLKELNMWEAERNGEMVIIMAPPNLPPIESAPGGRIIEVRSMHNPLSVQTNRPDAWPRIAKMTGRTARRQSVAQHGSDRQRISEIAAAVQLKFRTERPAIVPRCEDRHTGALLP